MHNRYLIDQVKNTVADLVVGDIARFYHRKYLGRFMVVARSPEGQKIGFTKIHYEEDGDEETLTWVVGNLLVEFLGRGVFIPQYIQFPQVSNTGELQDHADSSQEPETTLPDL